MRIRSAREQQEHDRKKERDRKSSKKKKSNLEAEVFAIMEKSLKTALDVALDDISKIGNKMRRPRADDHRTQTREIGRTAPSHFFILS